MKALFIGGTGTISGAVTRLALQKGWEVFHLNRGSRKGEFKGVTRIECDIRTQEPDAVRKKIENQKDGDGFFKALFGGTKKKTNGPLIFDVVVDFIGFVTEHVRKDYEIFNGLCRQFIYISSASAYQKPPSSCVISESTPLANPFWQYSRNKIACEEFLLQKYREDGFPVTIVRPSHTYDERSVPLGVHGKNGSWQVLKRMLDAKKVIIHGDGTSLWTLTHSSDFAEGFLALMGNIHAIGEAVHITSDEIVTWNQIYRTIADCLKVQLQAVHIASDFLDACSDGLYDFKGSLTGDKANSVIFDNTKIKRLAPGFCAKVRMDEGIRQTVANVLARRELQKEDREFDAWCDRVISNAQMQLKENQLQIEDMRT